MVLYSHHVDIIHWIITKISSIKDEMKRVVEFDTIVTMIINSLRICLEESN